MTYYYELSQLFLFFYVDRHIVKQKKWKRLWW